MAKKEIVVGYFNYDEEQISAIERIFEELDIEPIDQLIGTPETPVPEDVDYFSLIDILDEIVKKIIANKEDIQNHLGRETDALLAMLEEYVPNNKVTVLGQ